MCNLWHKICSKTDLNSNLALVHECEDPFKCAICDTRFALKTGMNSHMAIVHVGKDSLKCTMISAWKNNFLIQEMLHFSTKLE